jgi:MarR family transcriptional regulator for hemolysin
MNTAIDTARTRLGRLVSQTSRLWRRAADRRLQPYGLTEATWLPLLQISRSETAMNQKDLAATLSLDNSSVVRLVDALEAAGLVERREGQDRRAKTLALTPSGEETVSRVEQVAAELRDEAFAGLDPKDIVTAYRVLDHLCAVFSDPDGELQP